MKMMIGSKIERATNYNTIFVKDVICKVFVITCCSIEGEIRQVRKWYEERDEQGLIKLYKLNALYVIQLFFKAQFLYNVLFWEPSSLPVCAKY